MFAIESTPFILVSYWLVILSGLILAIALLARFGALLRFASIRKKLRDKNTVIAEYEPPFNLSAVEMGYLFDNRFADNELLAGVVALAQRERIILRLVGNEDFSLKLSPDIKNSQMKLSGGEAAILSFIKTFPLPANWSSISGNISEFIGAQEGFEKRNC